ncbi:PREDICTED: uncharacterized protein LOC109217536 [Nicotiana attenuata]|uniref:uncharacterized protein LOC109217536 n=1 Tax=Nicotiana attenuata TaxID=49451 RepID=UPI00090566E9|nr:PREDICTED: uncharacterized protein LOC109217536 [Nicotiana attenuata]
MLIKRNDVRSNPCYDPVSEDAFFSIKVYHKGSMKHQPTKQYVGGIVDYFDYVEMKDLNLAGLKKMVEICGYLTDSITFWHKCGKFGNRWRLVSTKVEAHTIEKFIPKDRVMELFFEHLDSYIGIDPVELDCQTSCIPNNEDVTGLVNKELERENLSGRDEFEDSKNEFSDEDAMVDKHGQFKHCFEDGRELVSAKRQRKMSNKEGVWMDNKSLDSDSDNESFDFPKHNPMTDGKNPVLALEYTFHSKKELKNAVTTYEVNEGRYIKWKKNDNIRIRAVCIHDDCEWEIMA